MTEPRFTIVIPTRDRPHLLRQALATTVAQRFRDAEILVSDNGTDPETKRVVDECDDGRIQYVRPDRVMTQPEHYNFALAQARGEWVVVYADDDGVPPSFLDRLDAAVSSADTRFAAWTIAYYVHRGMVGTDGNRLTVYPCTGSARVVESRDELRRVYARREDRDFPKFGINAAVRRDLLDEIRAHAGRLFEPPFLDYTFGPVALAVEPTYVFVDQPLIMSGMAETSIGLSITRRDAAGQAFLADLGGDDVLRSVPLKVPTLENLIAESIERARARVPHLFGGIELDPVGYLLGCHRDLGRGIRNPAFTEADAAAWRALVRLAPPAVRAAVVSGVAALHVRRATAIVRTFAAERLPAAAALLRKARGRRTPRSDFVHVMPEDAPFTDLVGAAGYLEEHVLAPLPLPGSERTAARTQEVNA